MDHLHLPARAAFSILTLLLLASPPPCRSDPDPLQDFCVGVLQGSEAAAAPANGLPCKPASAVAADDFFFSSLARGGNTSNALGSAVTAGNALTFPGLNTLGLSMIRVDFAPGGVNPPHSHPRATELVLVAEGRLLVGFVTTAGVLFSKVVGAGEVFVVPRGLVHFLRSVGEGGAVAFTAFNSQLPGAVIAAATLFGSNPPIPDDVLSRAFQVDGLIIGTIKSKFGS
uniref:Germin-like protein n=1 Tax=Anthurium amnicola TaxID=1678845 RepID=A0A1D1YID2_9ARAE